MSYLTKQHLSLAQSVLIVAMALSVFFSVEFLINIRAIINIVLGGDFKIFYLAGEAIRHGHSPYSTTFLSKVHNSFPYLPWVGLIFVPLSFFSFHTAYWIWASLIFLMIFFSAYILTKEFSWSNGFFISLVCAFSVPSFFNYFLGQISALALLLLALTVIAARRKCWVLLGVFSVAIGLLKIQDAFILIPLVWFTAVPFNMKTALKLAMGQMVSGIMLLFLPLFINPLFLNEWLKGILKFTNTFVQHPGNRAAMGIYGLFPLLPLDHTLKVIVAHGAIIIFSILGIIIVGFCLWFLLKWQQLENISRADRSTWVILLPLLAWMLFTPYANVQDLILLFPIVLLLLGKNGNKFKLSEGRVVCWAIFVIPALLIPIMNKYFLPYSIDCIGIVLIFMVAIKQLKLDQLKVK